MHAAIHAWFDRSLDDAIRDLEAKVLVHGSSGKRGCALRPHITLWACRDLDVRTFTDALAGAPITSEPIPVEFDSFGAFPVPASAIFLNPVPTTALLSMHRIVTQVLVRLGSSPANAHYLPDRWTPHCALAGELTAEDFSNALTELLDFRRPVTGRITRLGVVELPHDQEVMDFPLGSRTGSHIAQP